MSGDDDGDEEAPGFRQPPHPDDRLWRHPSEMDDHPIAPIGAPTEPPADAEGWRLRLVAAGALGVLVVIAGLAAVALGGLGRPDDGDDDAGTRSTAAAQGATGTDGDASAVADELAPSVVGVGTGSGVVVGDEGVVLTSAALVESDRLASVRLADGTAAAARILGVDEVTGIAVLDLPGGGHSAADLARPDATPTGPAYTVAAAVGSGEAAATAAAVGPSRKLGGVGEGGLDGVLEVEGRAERSALGGPVVDENGTVIGVTTAVGGERSYLTPIDVGLKVAGDLVDSGRVRHSWLGIEGIDRVEGSGLHAAGGHGAEIVTVADGGPADAAGLRPGDVVVELDGQPIERMPDLIRWLRSRSPGDQVELTVERDGESTTLTAALTERPG